MSAAFVCLIKMDFVAFDRLSNDVSCSKPFFVESPSSRIGVELLGGVVRSVAISESDHCRMKSLIVVSGMGML